MERRKFLGWMGLGLLATSLPMAIAACNQNNEEILSSDESLPNPTNKLEGPIVVGTVAQLEQEGQLVDQGQNAIVIKNPDNGNLIAVSAKCTHKGCVVDWQKEEQNFLCPCHQAKFSMDGKALDGPTKENLAVYQVREENGEIIVEV